jgi:S1-C subfamily serine protease
MSKTPARAATRMASGNWPTNESAVWGRAMRRVPGSWIGVIVAASTLAGSVWARDEGDPIPLLKSGTGFFVTTVGEVLTSAHVVRGCDRIEVWQANAVSGIVASLEAFDAQRDLALLATAHRVRDAARFETRPVRGDSEVVTIGFGFTSTDPLDAVVTRARTGSTTRSQGDELLMRARLYEGNSGGPVVDAHARVVGMVTGRYVNAPDVGVAIRASALVAFLARAARAPMMSATDGPGADPEKTLRDISVLVQCAQ